MVRQIVIPTEKNYTLVLPDEMLGQQVEILAFSTSETRQSNRYEAVPNKNLRAIFDGVRVDLSSFKFDRDEANDYE